MEILLQYKQKSTVVLVLQKKINLKLKRKYSFAKQKPFKNAINIKDILSMSL